MKLTEVSLGLGGGSLLQVAHRSKTQNLCYVIDTPDGSVAVLDGGYYTEEDGRNLYQLLKQRGGRVHTWLFSHGHEDHIGCLLWMMENIPDFDLKIDRICYNFPPTEWFGGLEGGGTMKYVARLRSQIEQRAIPVVIVHAGDVFDLGAMTARAFSDPSNYENYRTEVNSSTVVWKLSFPSQDVLFLADMSEEGEIDMCKHTDPSLLRCDIVQMAHHGQNGVSDALYAAISPKHCLWPTTLRSWNNEGPNGPGTGNSKVPETKRRMDELGAIAHYVTAHGDYLFR